MKELIRIVLLLALVVIVLVGCGSQGYRFVQDNGSNYIILGKSYDDAATLEQASQVAPVVIFDSFEEMRSDIITGNFSDEEFAEIARFQRDEASNVQVCSLDSLYEPTYPAIFNDYTISWSGTGYHHILTNRDTDARCAIYNSTADDYRDAAVRYTQDYIPTGYKESEVHISTERERNATVYTCTRYQPLTESTYTEKFIVYSFEVNRTEYYIREHYEPESGSVPTRIHIHGCSNGYYFYAHLSDLTERPSIEDLSQLGIQEYIETEVS